MEHGLPISWSTAWAELAWRFKRAHQPQDLGEEQRECGGEPLSSKAPHQVRIPLELENGVTSRNNKKVDRDRASKDVRRQVMVAALNEGSVSTVTKGSLVFVDVSGMEVGEGEMAIGLARAMQDCSSGQFKLKWYVRKEWVAEKKHKWSSSPSFQLAGDPSNPKRAYVTMEPLNKVLPIQVKLTSKNVRAGSVNPRLTAQCVLLAREYCQQHGLSRKQQGRARKQTGRSHIRKEGLDQEPPHLSPRIARDRLKRKRKEVLVEDASDEDAHSSSKEDSSVVASSEDEEGSGKD